MTTVADEEAKRLDLETLFTVLLVVTISLQLGALAARVAKRRRAALAMAGAGLTRLLAINPVTTSNPSAGK